MKKLAMTVGLTSALVLSMSEEIEQLVDKINNEIEQQVTLVKEPCVWPKCGREQQYEICLMPKGCSGSIPLALENSPSK